MVLEYQSTMIFVIACCLISGPASGNGGDHVSDPVGVTGPKQVIDVTSTGVDGFSDLIDSCSDETTTESMTETLSMTLSSTVTKPPTFKILLNFPTRTRNHEITHRNILEQIQDPTLFGVLLLNDDEGSIVKNIIQYNGGNNYGACKDIAYKWLKEFGLKPITWYTLVGVLKYVQPGLADIIMNSVSKCAMNTTSEKVYHELESNDLIETLKKVYRQEDLLDPNLWLSKHLPTVSQSYINLTLEEAGKETDLLTLMNSLQPGQRILLTGRPGVGKTTLLRYISKLWAAEDTKYMRTCEVLIKISLGKVSDMLYFEDFAHFLKVALSEDTMLVEKFSRELKMNKGKGACILLDAYDELKTERTKKFVRELLSPGVDELHLPKALYIVSTRFVSSNELETIANIRPVEVVGINDTNLQHFFQCLSSKNQTALKRFFKKQPNARYLCQIPLYLSMVVFVVVSNPETSEAYVIETETDLFTSFVNLTLEQYHTNRHPDWNRFSIWECSFSSQSPELQCEGFQALCSAAFRMVFCYGVSVRINVAEGVLDILQKRFQLDENYIESAREDISLVVEISKDKYESRDVIRFSFTDDSYDEFVQVLHLAGLPASEDISKVERFYLVGKGSTTEEHICTGYSQICMALNSLVAQTTQDPPVDVIDILHERSKDRKTFDYKPYISKTLTNISLADIIPVPTIRGEVLKFTFPHRTLQEFLCALHLSRLSQPEQLTYISLYGKESEYDLVFQFFFGLLKCKDCDSSRLLGWYSSSKSADSHNVVLKLARETKITGKQFKKLLQDSNIFINSSICIRIKRHDDCPAARYAINQVAASQAALQNIGLSLTLYKSSTSCLYSVHKTKEAKMSVDCPQHIKSYEYLWEQIRPVNSLLTYLSVRHCFETADDILAFANQLQTLSKLKSLHLLVTIDITTVGAEKLLTALQGLPQLESLQLDMEIACLGTQVLISKMKHLEHLHHLSLTLKSTDKKTLEEIDFRRHHFCWKYINDLPCPYKPFIDCTCSVHNAHQYFQYTGQKSKLATIFLSGNCSENLHIPMDHSFLAIAELKHLVTLILSIGLGYDSETMALFNEPHHDLKNLDLSYNYCDYMNDDNCSFTDFNLNEMEFLDIGHTSWEIDKVVNGLNMSTKLKVIKFTESRSYTDKALEILDKVQHFETLHGVLLDSCNVADVHISALSKYIANMHSLRVLDLGCNQITDAGFETLVNVLNHHPQFHHLDISYNQLSKVVIDSSLESLKYLRLAGNDMGFGGAVTLADSLKYLPNLVHLDLSNNVLTTDGVLYLAQELPLLTSLEYIDLSYNDLRLDTSDIEKLANCLKGVKSLKHVSLAGNKMSLDGSTVLVNQLKELHHLDLSNIANQLSIQ